MSLQPREIKIRSLGYEDIEPVCRIMVSIEPYAVLGYTGDQCIEAVLASVEEGWGAVAEAGGRVVGFILFRVFDGFPLGGYIRALGVDPGYRGMGVGSALLDYAEKTIFRYRRNVFLLVSSFNTRAIEFYRKRGYEVVGVIRDAIIRGADEIIMRKTIDKMSLYRRLSS